MKCHRGACDSDNAVCLHSDNGHLYCPSCARKINETAPGLVRFPIDAVKQLTRCVKSESETHVTLEGQITKEEWHQLLALRDQKEEPIPHGQTSYVYLKVRVELSHTSDTDLEYATRKLDVRILSGLYGTAVISTDVAKLVDE